MTQILQRSLHRIPTFAFLEIGRSPNWKVSLATVIPLRKRENLTWNVEGEVVLATASDLSDKVSIRNDDKGTVGELLANDISKGAKAVIFWEENFCT